MRLIPVRILLCGLLSLFAASAMTALPMDAKAQVASSPLGGFSSNKKDPIDIESDELEIRQKENIAIFTGRVIVVQGTMELKCARLVVKYHMVGKEGQRKREIKRLDATGGVVVTDETQSATSDWATMDALKNVIVMGDSVVISQEGNVIRGNKVLIDLNTGYSRIISNAGSGGRVRAIFKPKKK